MKRKSCEVVEIQPQRISAKSDLAQAKTENVREEIAKYFEQRGWPKDLETITEMGMNPDNKIN